MILLDFLGGHSQQNGEQLNNLLKTLDGYYNNAALKGVTDMPNKGEFIGYFIIFQVRREEKRREKKKRREEKRREEKRRKEMR